MVPKDIIEILATQIKSFSPPNLEHYDYIIYSVTEIFVLIF